MQFFERQREARRQTWRLIFLFLMAVVAMTLAINGGLALFWRLLSPWPAYPPYFFEVNTGVILLFVLGGWWVETLHMSMGGAALARRLGARPARSDEDDALGADERQFQRIVHELAIAAGMKPPKAFVIPGDMSINAFAAGWQEEDAVVTVTEGALHHLDRRETLGLVAHELSHIREGDAVIGMRLAGMVFGLEMVYGFGASLTERDEQGRWGPGVLPGWIIQALGWCGHWAGRWLMSAVLREREFLADARSVQYTRDRDGIGGVLRKALTWRQEHLTTHAQQSFAGPQTAVSHLWLVQEVQGAESGVFASHPPLTERIRRIYGRPMRGLPLDDSTDSRVAQ